MKHADHLLRAQHCELKLDSTLCNAHTSGTDSLWAGTPMLTLPGETQAARVALSLLTTVASRRRSRGPSERTRTLWSTSYAPSSSHDSEVSSSLV